MGICVFLGNDGSAIQKLVSDTYLFHRVSGFNIIRPLVSNLRSRNPSKEFEGSFEFLCTTKKTNKSQ